MADSEGRIQWSQLLPRQRSEGIDYNEKLQLADVKTNSGSLLGTPLVLGNVLEPWIDRSLTHGLECLALWSPTSFDLQRSRELYQGLGSLEVLA